MHKHTCTHTFSRRGQRTEYRGMPDVTINLRYTRQLTEGDDLDDLVYQRRVLGV